MHFSGGKELTSLFVKTTTLYCSPIWLDLVLVLTTDSDDLGGIGIHRYPASCSFVLRIHASGYLGVGVSGYRAGAVVGYQDLVTWLLRSLVSRGILEVSTLTRIWQRVHLSGGVQDPIPHIRILPLGRWKILL